MPKSAHFSRKTKNQRHARSVNQRRHSAPTDLEGFVMIALNWFDEVPDHSPSAMTTILASNQNNCNEVQDDMHFSLGWFFARL
jgi:hypothetical protein